MISTKTLLRNWKKLWNMKVTFIPTVIDALCTVTKGLIKGLEDGNKRTSGNYPSNCITEKSPGHLRRLAVTQTPMKDHWCKNSQGVTIIIILTRNKKEERKKPEINEIDNIYDDREMLLIKMTMAWNDIESIWFTDDNYQFLQDNS